MTPPVDEMTMLIRIAAAAALGLVIGLERETRGRAAGLRSCMLISMAGALVMSLSLHLAQMFASMAADSVARLDPARLPSYAVAGMGFLGAGAIIQGRRSARGVTTAAAMWTCTVVGLAVGAGLYRPAVLVVGVTVLALAVLPRAVQGLRHEQFVNLTVEATDKASLEDVRRLLDANKAEVLFCGRHRCLESDRFTYNFYLLIKSGPRWGELLDKIEAVEGVACFSWQEAEVP